MWAAMKKAPMARQAAMAALAAACWLLNGSPALAAVADVKDQFFHVNGWRPSPGEFTWNWSFSPLFQPPSNWSGDFRLGFAGVDPSAPFRLTAGSTPGADEVSFVCSGGSAPMCTGSVTNIPVVPTYYVQASGTYGPIFGGTYWLSVDMYPQVSPVPLPSAALFFGTGLLALAAAGLVRSRRPLRLAPGVPG